MTEPRRTRQTILLLGTLLDVHPAPDTWTGRMLERSTKRGPAPSRWRTCSDCQGVGRTLDKFGRETPCVTCGGKGRYPIDDYTNERVGTSSSLVVRSETVRCDRCDGAGVWKFKRCDLCDGEGRRSITRARGDATQAGGGTDPKRNLDLWGRGGSYHELDQALGLLHTQARLTHRLVWTFYVAKGAPDIGEHGAWAIGNAVQWIAWRMPDPILVPAWAYATEKNTGTVRGRWANGNALQKRDQEIHRLRKEGRAVQWIAKHTGLSLSHTYLVLKSG